MQSNDRIAWAHCAPVTSTCVTTRIVRGANGNSSRPCSRARLTTVAAGLRTRARFSAPRDAKRGEWQSVALRRDPACVACGRG